MALFKNMGMAGKVLISLAIAAAVVILAYFIIGALSSTATPKTPNKISIISDGGKASWVGTILQVVLGLPGKDITVENLALYLAVFIILLFAFGEIIQVFSFFSETTSWIIALALAVIAGATGITPTLAGAFAGAVALGALGIIIILVTAFIAAAALHIGVGKALRKWRIDRQKDIEETKAGMGAAKVGAAITGLKTTEEAFKKGERA